MLILDEPTIAIDPAGVEELLALLRRLVAERNLTVLLSSHILGQVQSLCDRVGFFAAGRLVAAGPLAELARAPTSSIELEVGDRRRPDGDRPGRDGRPRRALRQDGRARRPPPDRDGVGRRRGPARRRRSPPPGLSIVHLRRRGSDLLELYRRYVPEATDGRAR